MIEFLLLFMLLAALEWAVLAKENAEKALREAEWQAHLATLSPEQRAEEDGRRANQIERARAIIGSMERTFLFGCEPNPLTKLLQGSKTTQGIEAAITTNVKKSVVKEPIYKSVEKRSNP